jgi:hypothetical protein
LALAWQTGCTPFPWIPIHNGNHLQLGCLSMALHVPASSPSPPPPPPPRPPPSPKHRRIHVLLPPFSLTHTHSHIAPSPLCPRTLSRVVTLLPVSTLLCLLPASRCVQGLSFCPVAVLHGGGSTAWVVSWHTWLLLDSWSFSCLNVVGSLFWQMHGRTVANLRAACAERPGKPVR